MEIEELMQSIPPELQGNISLSAGRVTITCPEGRGFCVYELSGGATGGMGALKAFSRTEFESGTGIRLQEKPACGY